MAESDRPKKKARLAPSSESDSVLADSVALYQSSLDILSAFTSSSSASSTASNSSLYQVSTSPFPSIILENLFSPTFLLKVKKELLSLPYYPRKSDLFSYFGTHDISTDESTNPALAQLRREIHSKEFTTFLQDATGVVELIPRKVDMSSHIYKRGDWLGCHDDAIEQADQGRRIAFIIYLVDEAWSEKEGGNLALFDL